MDILSDILLLAGTLGATAYCIVLSRRLSKFNDLEKGMGGAIAVLSVQVDDMTSALSRAQTSAAESRRDLTALTERAELAAQKLELMLASIHDVPAKPAAAHAGSQTAGRPTAAAPIGKSARTEGRDEPVSEAPGWRSRRPLQRAV